MTIDQARIARMLNPRSVVVVGAKGPTFKWIENKKEFTGDLYSVQVDPAEITGIEALGFKNFTSSRTCQGRSTS